MNEPLIYFDNNATTRPDDAVLAAMQPYFTPHYGNAASRLHAFGWSAQSAVEKASAQIASLIHCEPSELLFTSGATESVNLAIKGIFEAYASKGNHIITCKTEHRAVLDTCTYLETKGAEVTYLDVDREGLISTEALRGAIKDSTILVCIMAANNETGVMQPLEKISAICEEKKVIFFSDATQLVGKERCDVKESGIHCMAFSAHKMHGPKGIGALYLRRRSPRVTIVPQMHGGGHQDGRRSGTLNVPLIAGFGTAAEIAAAQYWENSAQVSKLRNYFEHQLLEIEGLTINGSTRHRLHNTSNLTFPSKYKIAPLLQHFAFSSGSACSSASPEPSHVLCSMGLNNEEVKQTFRFSFSKYNTLDEIRLFLDAFKTLNV